MFWAKHRRLILWSLYILFFLHAIVWYCLGYQKIGQLGFGELFNTLKNGVFTAGTVFTLLVFVHALFFGGIFCGWFCHWGITQDVAAWIMKKCGIKPVMRHLDSKLIPWAWFIILLGQVGLYWFFNGFPKEASFEAAKTAVWAGNPTAILMICMTTIISGFLLIFLFGERAFCRSICTFRLWFSWFDKIAPYRIRRIHDCGACEHECTDSCFMDIDVAKEIKLNGVIRNSACVKCFRCMGACPNASLTASFKKGENEKNEPVEQPAPQFDLLASIIQVAMALTALHFLGYTIGGNMSLSTGFLIGFVMIHIWHTKSIDAFEIIAIVLAAIGLYFANDIYVPTAVVKGLAAIAIFIALAKYLGFKKGFDFIEKMPGNVKISKVLVAIAVALGIYAGGMDILSSYNISKGNAALNNNDLQTYVDCYEKWADYHSQPDEANFDLAKVELLLRRHDKCTEALQKSLDYNYREDLAIQSVEILMDNGLSGSAKQLVSHLIEKGHDSETLRNLLAEAESAVAKKKAAILGNK